MLQGIPHRSIDDDVYNGMYIPKGSLVIANTRYVSSTNLIPFPILKISDVQRHDSG
jgi:hypothetical protein